MTKPTRSSKKISGSFADAEIGRTYTYSIDPPHETSRWVGMIMTEYPGHYICLFSDDGIAGIVPKNVIEELFNDGVYVWVT